MTMASKPRQRRRGQGRLVEEDHLVADPLEAGGHLVAGARRCSRCACPAGAGRRSTSRTSAGGDQHLDGDVGVFDEVHALAERAPADLGHQLAGCAEAAPRARGGRTAKVSSTSSPAAASLNGAAGRLGQEAGRRSRGAGSPRPWRRPALRRTRSGWGLPSANSSTAASGSTDTAGTTSTGRVRSPATGSVHLWKTG